MAINDEILEISGEEVKCLWEDQPGSEELMKRLQERLNQSPDHVTVKVLQEDGLTNSYRMLRAPIIIPGIQVWSRRKVGAEYSLVKNWGVLGTCRHLLLPLTEGG